MTDSVRTPTAAPAAAYLGALLALGTVALGAVGIRDGILAAGWIHGSSWTAAAIDAVDGTTFHPWMIPAGIAALLLGALCVFAALKPRRRTAVPVPAHPNVFLRRADTAQADTAHVQGSPR